MVIYLGSFKVTGNKIHISDPCNNYDSVGAAKIVNVLPGKYLAKLTLYYLKNWGVRVAKLSIWHEKHKNVLRGESRRRIWGYSDAFRLGLFAHPVKESRRYRE